MPHEHPAEEADAAMDSEDSDSNEAVQEAELLIQKQSFSDAEIRQKHCTQDKPDVGFHGGMLQSSDVVAGTTGLSGEIMRVPCRD